MPIPLNVNRFRRQAYSTIPVPLAPQTRVASVNRNKIQVGDLRYFPEDRWDQIERFQPQVLIGSTANLRSLANLADDGILDFSSIDTAIFAATEFGASTITDIDRVVFWQCFGVPVYEFLLSPDGRLLASECEAHAGWHLESNMQRQYLQSAQIETALCACGRREPRIMAEDHPQLIGVLAAIA